MRTRARDAVLTLMNPPEMGEGKGGKTRRKKSIPRIDRGAMETTRNRPAVKGLGG